jgi:TolB-like protein
MKKVLIVLFFILLFGSYIFAQTDNLLVVVVPFSARSGYTQDEGDVIAELVSTLLVQNGNIEVFTRSHFDKLVNEQVFQASGFTEENYARMGAAVNANALVSGSIMKLGNRTILTSSLMDVESGKILISSRLQLADINEVFDEIPKLVNGILVALGPRGKFIGKWKYTENEGFLTFSWIRIRIFCNSLYYNELHQKRVSPIR